MSDEITFEGETPAPPLERLPETDHGSLRALLDDVLVSAAWVERQCLRWVPGPPANEALELSWLEGYLGMLEQAAGRARGKVEWRRKVAEEREEAARIAAARAGLDERWEGC